MAMGRQAPARSRRDELPVRPGCRLQALEAIARLRGFRARHESHRRSAFPRHALALAGGGKVTTKPATTGRGYGAIALLVATLILAACTAFAQDQAPTGPPPSTDSDAGDTTPAQAEDAGQAPPTAPSAAASAQAWATAADLSSGL